MPVVKKAVIPVAGYGTRHYPATKIVKKELFPILDRSGFTKPLIQVIIEEAVDSGIEEICLITQSGDEQLFKGYFNTDVPSYLEEHLSGLSVLDKISDRIRELGQRIIYVEQESQQGYGHAVYCSRDFVGKDSFLLLLGDHIYHSYSEKPCAQQLMETYASYHSSISAVTRTKESQLHLFGTIGGERPSPDSRVIKIRKIKEKPPLSYAKLHLRVFGMPHDEYLCWFGQHIFTQSIFDALKYQIDKNIRERGEIQLTSAQELVLHAEGKYLAYETDGIRYDTGEPIAYAETLGAYYKKAERKCTN